MLKQWKADAELESRKELENPRHRPLGTSRPALAPPIEYQLAALGQVVAHLRNSGITEVGRLQLSQVLSSPLYRDGINPIFEPLSAKAVVDAISEFIQTGKLAIRGQQFILIA